ncbi:MAG: glycosyltransferase [Thaumarchaeota archaeon]|nr:glycosyltransferase [Nitrososphaerota archaeon]
MELLIALLTLLLLGSSIGMAVSIKKRIVIGRHLPKLPKETVSLTEKPLVSIIVPFRNEETNLPNLFSSIAQQNYPNLEIILVDDQSSDKSHQIAKDFESKHKNCRVVSVKEKPEGWTGKTWACEEGFRNSNGEWLLFTDADVEFEKSVISKALGFAISNKIDVLTLMPRMLCQSFWSKVIQPIFVHVLIVLYSPLRVNNPKDPFAYVFGSFFLIQKSKYVQIGEHEVVRKSLIEDRALGFLAKQKGLKIIMLEAADRFTSVWAKSLVDVIHVIERIASYSINVNPLRGVAFAVGTLMVTVLPFIALLLSLLWYSQRLAFSEIVIVLSLVAGILTFLASSIEILGSLKLSPIYVIVSPLGGLLFSISMLTAAYKNAFRKKIVWRGREYETAKIEF